MEHEEENRAITRVLNGDPDAYAILVKRYERPIYNLMLRMTASSQDALDLSQTAFIKAYERLEQFKQGRRFFPWLYTIALNLARDFTRRRKIDAPGSRDWEEFAARAAVPANQESSLIARATAIEVKEALHKISWEYREPLVLRFYENLSFKEVAAALDLSLSAAKMRVHRGLTMLRRLILEAGDG